jgi:predicted RNA-binding Zn ribbon-like protein
MADSDSDFRDGVPFLGGALWIDLLNTTPVIAGQPMDLIGDAEALARWARLAGVEGGPGDDAREVATTGDLREALRVAFEALRQGAAPDGSALGRINRHLADVTLTRAIAAGPGGAEAVPRLSVTGPVVAARAAADFADFLEAGLEPARLKHCANPACTMVFYDRGKNNRRRWCSMQACGNRDKVANYRARKAGRAV